MDINWKNVVKIMAGGTLTALIFGFLGGHDAVGVGFSVGISLAGFSILKII